MNKLKSFFKLNYMAIGGISLLYLYKLNNKIYYQKLLNTPIYEEIIRNFESSEYFKHNFSIIYSIRNNIFNFKHGLYYR